MPANAIPLADRDVRSKWVVVPEEMTSEHDRSNPYLCVTINLSRQTLRWATKTRQHDTMRLAVVKNMVRLLGECCVNAMSIVMDLGGPVAPLQVSSHMQNDTPPVNHKSDSRHLI